MFDVIPVSEVEGMKQGITERSILSFSKFIEQRFDASFLIDARQVPFDRPDLFHPLIRAEELIRAGIIRSLAPIEQLSDEPSLKYWKAFYGEGAEQAGGADAYSEEQALRATLSEALERYLWTETDDWFERPLHATVAQMSQKRLNFIHPDRFAGFSEAQRKPGTTLFLGSNSEFLWIRGVSLASGSRIFVPAQTASGLRNLKTESLVRPRVTTGLATWMDATGARVRGTLEVVERDAYMIMWLNQLTLPRIALSPLRQRSTSLALILDTCARYRLHVAAVHLITDAPAHVACILLTDESGVKPQISVGLKAHRSLPDAVEGAIIEALRARQGCRRFFNTGGVWRVETAVEDVGHRDRMYYWAAPESARRLAWMKAGDEQVFAEAAWEKESDKAYLERIAAWCRSAHYECISVPLGISRHNPTSLSVEMIVMPDMQPMHITEKARALGGARIREIPRLFGYQAREEAFTEAPHPFS